MSHGHREYQASDPFEASARCDRVRIRKRKVRVRKWPGEAAGSGVIYSSNAAQVEIFTRITQNLHQYRGGLGVPHGISGKIRQPSSALQSDCDRILWQNGD